MEKCVKNFVKGRANVAPQRKDSMPRLRALRLPLFSALPRLPSFCLAWLPLSLLLFGCDAAFSQTSAPARVAGASPIPTAFFYGAPVPLERLAAYPRVVVEADNLPEPANAIARLAAGGTTVFAYVSVGEAEGWRSSTRALDASLFLGENAAWNSRVADLSQQGWRDFLINERMSRLWQQGYRAFFLDTLDSYQMASTDPAQRERQACGLAAIVRAMHQHFPGVQLLLNRGFEVLPSIGSLASGLVAESLYRSWDASAGRYVEVSPQDRDWLLARLQETRQRYGLPITVIDYVAPGDTTLALATARRIEAQGYAAWVATPALDSVPEQIK